MHKYAIAYSLFMISPVMAARHFHAARQIISQQPTTPPTTPPTPPATGPSRPPVTTPASTPAPSPTTTSQPSFLPPILPTLTSSALVTTTSISSATEIPTTPLLPTTPLDSLTTTSTDAAGQVQTVTVAASDTSSAAPSPTQTSSNSDNSIKPGTIIGLSVAGGIAAIAVIAFVIWKLTRKRFSDLDDPDEAIKWPELNRESNVDGSGLSRQPSNSYSNGTSRNASAVDQSEYADPYAVPPLPQFNPNQPYRDDPVAVGASGYYDPYRGPVPQTFNEMSSDGHESIPMSTYPPGSRTRSPGPGPSYDMGGRGSPAPGRASPGPGAMYDMGGRGSPAPGRTISPGPAAALGLDRRPSPAPQLAYGGQPEMASRSRSPGPNILA